MKKTLNDKEKVALNRISGLIRRKLVHLGDMREPIRNVDMPVTLIELMQYQTGRRQVPLCHLASLLEFYGCSWQEIAMWNVKVSVLTFRALKKARGEENPSRPEMDI